MSAKRAADLLAAAKAGDLARVQALLPPSGKSLEDGLVAAPGSMTPLMAAAAGGHKAVLELLLQHGADPARRDAQGRSAAAYARAAGYPHLAERLDTVVDKEQTLR
jgi:ankyrin repeat protein